MTNIQLISIQQAKDHLRKANLDDGDFDIDAKLSEASGIVMRYAKLDVPPPEWFNSRGELAPPYNIRSATEVILGELYLNRESTTVNPLSPGAMDLIDRLPTMA